MRPQDFEEGEEKPPSACELCGRAEELTRHHLIPKSRHRKARTRRHFSKDEMRTRLIWICWPCHKNLHRCLTEQEMAENYHSLEELKEHPEVGKFIRWICHKPPGFIPAGM
jgi:heterodisulfide reductase subunit C